MFVERQVKVHATTSMTDYIPSQRGHLIPAPLTGGSVSYFSILCFTLCYMVTMGQSGVQ